MPWARSFSATSGRRSARTISVLSRVTAAAGVAAGTTNPAQLGASSSGWPTSRNVGTLGSCSARPAVDTTIARILPVATCGATSSTLPAIIALVGGHIPMMAGNERDDGRSAAGVRHVRELDLERLRDELG